MKRQAKGKSGVKKAVRRHPFERALMFAERRLDKAKQERERASVKLQDLNIEIPDLERKIAALRGESNVGLPFNYKALAIEQAGRAKANTQRDVELLPDLVQPPVGEDDFLPEIK